MTMPKPKRVDEQVHFTLLENGLDFVWSAVHHLSTAASKRELKYALLHLVSGIELILKERLRREDWRLLFQKPEEARESQYKSGNFFSVNFDILIDRLQGECSVELSDEELQALRTVRRQRNRFEHFAADASAEAVIAATTEALSVIVDFIRRELDNDHSEREHALLAEIRGKLTELAAFVETRLKNIAGALDDAYAVLPCSVCRQDALTVDDGVECVFCGYKADGGNAADDYVANTMGIDRFRFEKDGGVWPVGICPSCGWQACVDANEAGFMCFGCGLRRDAGDLTECGRCTRYIERDNDIGICDSCFEEQVSKAD